MPQQSFVRGSVAPQNLTAAGALFRRLWFPGYMDWEHRNVYIHLVGLGNESRRGHPRSEVICTMCIPSIIDVDVVKCCRCSK